MQTLSGLEQCSVTLAQMRQGSLSECTGTSVTFWTGDIRYKSFAPEENRESGFHRSSTVISVADSCCNFL
jgi:hypothetical protein